MKFIFILSLIIAPFFVKAQDPSVLTRPAYTLKITVDKETVYEDEINSTPYMFPDYGIQIYPGETIFIEAEENDGKIKGMKAVRENKNPRSTIIVKFSQLSKDKIHESMMLTIYNPFSKDLIYKAKIFLLKKSKWHDTNVFPVTAGVSSFEIWPDIIISMGLDGWQFKSK